MVSFLSVAVLLTAWNGGHGYSDGIVRCQFTHPVLWRVTFLRKRALKLARPAASCARMRVLRI